MKILATVGDVSGFAIFSLDRFRTPFLDLPGPLLGGYLDPRQAETGLLGGLGPSKSRFQLLFFGPGGLQERSKRPTGGENKRPEQRTIAKRSPRGFQDTFWSPLREDFGAIQG